MSTKPLSALTHLTAHSLSTCPSSTKATPIYKRVQPKSPLQVFLEHSTKIPSHVQFPEDSPFSLISLHYSRIPYSRIIYKALGETPGWAWPINLIPDPLSGTVHARSTIHVLIQITVLVLIQTSQLLLEFFGLLQRSSMARPRSRATALAWTLPTRARLASVAFHIAPTPVLALTCPNASSHIAPMRANASTQLARACSRVSAHDTFALPCMSPLTAYAHYCVSRPQLHATAPVLTPPLASPLRLVRSALRPCPHTPPVCPWLQLHVTMPSTSAPELACRDTTL
ncbi:hypothetical protein SLEP1_g58734 [Rubroshorea leprosula]|uniref:Uncharacterized protein n=1 Tax=Rubroshorea leprosula TaxID=152421 RepID=A0AAV5MRG8_9ROSI|nr:hypothetical protein SLEP1_g58734 [Rubroshorea leprosula]